MHRCVTCPSSQRERSLFEMVGWKGDPEMAGRGGDPSNRIRRANRWQEWNKKALGESNNEFEGYVEGKVSIPNAESKPTTVWSQVGRETFDENIHEAFYPKFTPAKNKHLSDEQLTELTYLFLRAAKIKITAEWEDAAKALVLAFLKHFHSSDALNEPSNPSLTEEKDGVAYRFLAKHFKDTVQDQKELFTVFRKVMNDVRVFPKETAVKLKDNRIRPVPTTTYSGRTATPAFREHALFGPRRKLYDTPENLAELLESFWFMFLFSGWDREEKRNWLENNITDWDRFLASSQFPRKAIKALGKYDVGRLHVMWKKLRAAVAYQHRINQKKKQQQKGSGPRDGFERPDARYRASLDTSTLNPARIRNFMSRNGGPFGHYLMDLLDMGKNSATFNHKFKYIFTVMNTNSRFVYADSLQKKSGKEIEVSFARMLGKMEEDAKQPGMTHRKMTAVTCDGGKEFERWLRQALQEKGIAVHIAEKSTHEELSRLNSFHRRLREFYSRQFRNFNTGRDQYNSKWVKWVSDPDGNGRGEEIELNADDGKKGKQEVAEVEEEEDEEPDEEELEKQKLAQTNKRRVEMGLKPLVPVYSGEKKKEEEGEKEEKPVQKMKITYWEDWVDELNNRKKKRTFAKIRGRRGSPHLSPADIKDEHVRALIEEDEEVSDRVAERVNQWIRDNHVVWQKMLPKGKKHHATRVRLWWSERTFIEGQMFNKNSVLTGGNWSVRHYPLVDRVGSNTFTIQHSHGSDIPTVWPMYRLLIAEDTETLPEGKQTKFTEKMSKEEADEMYLKILGKNLEKTEKKTEERKKKTKQVPQPRDQSTKRHDVKRPEKYQVYELT